MREAYSLLRQSIIHVEQDDISFEEDGEPAAGQNGHAGTSQTNEESMDAADIAALEAAESSFQQQQQRLASEQASGRASSAGPAVDPSKRKMRITCKCRRAVTRGEQC